MNFTTEKISMDDSSVTIEPITFAIKSGKVLAGLKIKTGRKEIVLTTNTAADLCNIILSNVDDIQTILDETEDAAEKGILFQDGKLVSDKKDEKKKEKKPSLIKRPAKADKPASNPVKTSKPAKKQDTDIKAANDEVKKKLLALFS